MQLNRNVSQKNEAGRTGIAPVSPLLRRAPRFWVVTVDELSARAFMKEDSCLEPVEDIAPGRRPAKSGKKRGGLYAVPQDDDGEAFLRQAAAWLEESLRGNRFDRLIIVAPPHILGRLRKLLSVQVHGRIAAELSKDLPSREPGALRDVLKKFLWF
jgi:protein required for attachment to host cells